MVDVGTWHTCPWTKTIFRWVFGLGVWLVVLLGCCSGGHSVIDCSQLVAHCVPLLLEWAHTCQAFTKVLILFMGGYRSLIGVRGCSLLHVLVTILDLLDWQLLWVTTIRSLSPWVLLLAGCLLGWVTQRWGTLQRFGSLGAWPLIGSLLDFVRNWTELVLWKLVKDCLESGLLIYVWKKHELVDLLSTSPKCLLIDVSRLCNSQTPWLLAKAELVCKIEATGSQNWRFEFQHLVLNKRAFKEELGKVFLCFLGILEVHKPF